MKRKITTYGGYFERFIATLLDARKNARLTQEELAQRIGANKSYISRIEKGITVSSVATFYMNSECLSCIILLFNQLLAEQIRHYTTRLSLFRNLDKSVI